MSHLTKVQQGPLLQNGPLPHSLTCAAYKPLLPFGSHAFLVFPQEVDLDSRRPPVHDEQEGPRNPTREAFRVPLYSPGLFTVTDVGRFRVKKEEEEKNKKKRRTRE